MDAKAREWILGETRDKIEQEGFTVIGTLDEAGRWLLYTVGLHEQHRPELVLRGLPPEVGNPILQQLGRACVDDGDQLAAGARDDVLRNYTVYLVLIDTTELGVVRAMYGTDLPVMQVVWPDSTGVYPWDPGYSVLGQPAMAKPDFL